MAGAGMIIGDVLEIPTQPDPNNTDWIVGTLLAAGAGRRAGGPKAD